MYEDRMETREARDNLGSPRQNLKALGNLWKPSRSFVADLEKPSQPFGSPRNPFKALADPFKALADPFKALATLGDRRSDNRLKLA